MHREYMIDERKVFSCLNVIIILPSIHISIADIVMYHTRVTVYSYHVVLPAHEYSALVHSYFALFNIAAVAQYTSFKMVNCERSNNDFMKLV